MRSTCCRTRRRLLRAAAAAHHGHLRRLGRRGRALRCGLEAGRRDCLLRRNPSVPWRRAAVSVGDPILTPTSGFQPYALVAADFNGDGHLDLALSNGGGLVYIFLGNGDGTFTQESALTAPAGSISLSVGTLDPGGTLDLVASGPGGVTYWSGLGNGNFAPPQVLSLEGPSRQTSSRISTETALPTSASPSMPTSRSSSTTATARFRPRSSTRRASPGRGWQLPMSTATA